MTLQLGVGLSDPVRLATSDLLEIRRLRQVAQIVVQTRRYSGKQMRLSRKLKPPVSRGGCS